MTKRARERVGQWKLVRDKGRNWFFEYTRQNSRGRGGGLGGGGYKRFKIREIGGRGRGAKAASKRLWDNEKLGHKEKLVFRKSSIKWRSEQGLEGEVIILSKIS